MIKFDLKSVIFFPIWFTKDNDEDNSSNESYSYITATDCSPEDPNPSKATCENRGCDHDVGRPVKCSFTADFGFACE